MYRNEKKDFVIIDTYTIISYVGYNTWYFAQYDSALNQLRECRINAAKRIFYDKIEDDWFGCIYKRNRNKRINI